MPPLRVLHVIPSVSPRDGGPARAIVIMERALAEAGVEVTTLTTDHDLDRARSCARLASDLTSDGVRRIYARKWLTPYKVAPGLVPRLLQAAGEHDVVHIHALFSFAATVAAWVARRRRVPYVLRPLGTLSGYGLNTRRRRLKAASLRLIEAPMLQHAAAVHFTSQAELENARALGLPMRGIVIPLALDVGGECGAAPLAHEALAGRHVILFLSRLDPIKNLEALIDAVGSSPALRGSCALLIGGDGEPRYVAGLKARAAAAGLSERTVWLGHIAGAEKQAALAAADVFVLPSFSENFGIAAAEALLAGLPCVLGDGVAIAREVAAAGAGATVAPEPTAIAAALASLLGDEELRFGMAGRAAAFARREYSTRMMAQRLIALYESVRAAKPTGKRPTALRGDGQAARC